MSEKSRRELKVFLSEEDCAYLCDAAAERDLDVNTFMSMICLDIAKMQNTAAADHDLFIRHLYTYLETRFHESDDGFLSCLYADEAFEKAVTAMKNLEDPAASAKDVQRSTAFLDSLYEEYSIELKEDADPKDIAMEKLDKACKGRMGLSDADPFRAYLSAIYLAADNNGKQDHKELIDAIRDAYDQIRDEY